MTVDPKYRLIISLIVTMAIGITQGTVSLTDAIPADLIKPVVAWCGIIAFIGSSVNTIISALGTTNTSRLAAAEPVPLPAKLDALMANHPEVKRVETTPVIAAATLSPNVVKESRS